MPHNAATISESGNRRRAWTTLMVALALCLGAKPASAQDAPTGDWVLQGGPYLGASYFLNGERVREFGLRLGARRGDHVLDLNLFNFPIIYRNPRSSRQAFEVLAGVAWQPSALGIGFRSGLGFVPGVQGDYETMIKFGPHYAFEWPLGESLQFRSEAGMYVFHDSGIWNVSRGYLRVGIERRLRP